MPKIDGDTRPAVAGAPAPLAALRAFLALESAGGILLLIAAAAALLLDNSPLSPTYRSLLELHAGVTLGSLALEKSLLHWINDGLMAVFFLLVGLEIKREVLEGELSSARQVALPGLCALGGMAAPAAIYLLINRATPENLNGWAIPAATDIAFAMGVMALLGRRVPEGLKIFLLALAIIDDLGAIVIIALFYTANLSLLSLGLAAIGIVALAVLNRAGVTRLAPYILVGVFIWVCVLKSGVHATLAGVAIGFAIPLRTRDPGSADEPPLRRLEHALHPWVTFAIMPVFAFANAGVPLGGVGLDTLLQPVTLGIAGGLFLGKQLGVLGVAALGAAAGVLRLPQGATWPQMYGTALLTGIGFTMSLFIGTLAFAAPEAAAPLRLGVLAGSILSAVAGYAVLRLAPAARG
ncbi:MAG TPA: Na+/H+ antiporter NhaA [Dongiaceae bacterium]|jgi:NhaA family Na+:H+ antiporter|nr:Na+/H+ antiporter NhaA [Dongiaceae bacterium]